MEFNRSDLDYLHDAELHEIKIEFLEGQRHFEFCATFHPECGAVGLKNQKISVEVKDLSYLECQQFGDIHGQEEIDFCEVKLINTSSGFVGNRPKSADYCLSMKAHSGSTWKVFSKNHAQISITTVDS